MPDIKELERFVQGGGDVSSIPDDVWTSAGLAPELKQKIVVFQRGKGDTASITLQPTAQPAPKPAAAPETSLKDQLIQSFHAGADRYIQNMRNMATAPQPAYDDPSLANLLSDPNLIDKMGKGFINFEGRTPVLGPGLSPFKTWAIRRFNELMGLGMQAIAPPMAVAQTAAEDISGALTGQGPGLVPVEQQVEPGTGLVPRLGHATAQAVGLPFTVGGTAAQGAAALGADQDTQQLVGNVAPLLLLTGAGGGALEAVPGVGKFGAMVERGSNKVISKAESLAQKLPGNRPPKPVYIPPIEIEGFSRPMPETVKARESLTQTARTKPVATETRGFDKADQPTTKGGKPIQNFENSDGSQAYVLQLQEDGSYAVRPPEPVEATINASSPNSVPTLPPIKIAAPEDFQVSEPGGTKQLGKRKKGGKVKPTARFNEAEPVSTSGAEAATGGNKPVPTIQPTGSNLALPPEIQAVVDGNAPAWFLPHEAEGTIPTKGEAFVRSLDKPTPPVEPRVRIRGPRTGAADASVGARSKVINIDPTGTSTISPALGAALGPKVRILETREGTIVFNPEIVTAEQIKTLESEGRVADVVNGPRTSPKPEKPTLAVIARDAEGTEVRTILADNEAKAKAAVEYQQAQGLKTEVVPADSPQAVAVLRERLTVPLKAKSQVLSRSRYVDSLGAEEGSKGSFNALKAREESRARAAAPKPPIDPNKATSGDLASAVLRTLQEKDSFYSDSDTLTTLREKARSEGKSAAQVILETAKNEALNDPNVKLLEETIDAETQSVDRPVGNVVKELDLQDNRQNNSGVIGGARAETGMSEREVKTRGTKGGRKTKEVEAKAEARRQLVLDTIRSEYADTPDVVKAIDALKAKAEGSKVVGRKMQPVILQQAWAKLKAAIPDLALEDVAHALTGVRRSTRVAENITGEKPSARFNAKPRVRRSPNDVGIPDRVWAETQPRKGHVYRGMEPAEFENTVARGRGVQSMYAGTQEEGTSFLKSSDAKHASEYAAFGDTARSSPREIGYVVEVRRSPDIHQSGGLPDPGEIIGFSETPFSDVTRVWEVHSKRNVDGKFEQTLYEVPKEAWGTKEKALVRPEPNTLKNPKNDPSIYLGSGLGAPKTSIVSPVAQRMSAHVASSLKAQGIDVATSVTRSGSGTNVTYEFSRGGQVLGKAMRRVGDDGAISLSTISLRGGTRILRPLYEAESEFARAGGHPVRARLTSDITRAKFHEHYTGAQEINGGKTLEWKPAEPAVQAKPEIVREVGAPKTSMLDALDEGLKRQGLADSDLASDVRAAKEQLRRVEDYFDRADALAKREGITPGEARRRLGPVPSENSGDIANAKRADIVEPQRLPAPAPETPDSRAAELERLGLTEDVLERVFSKKAPPEEQARVLDAAADIHGYRLEGDAKPGTAMYDACAAAAAKGSEQAVDTYLIDLDFKAQTKARKDSSVTLGSGLGALQPLLEKGSKAASKLGSDIFDSAITELSKVNTEGKILAQKMAQVIHESARDYHRNVIPLDEAWKALSAEDKAAINAMPRQSRQDYRGMSPAAQAYGAAWHDTVNRLENERYKVYNFIQGRGGPRRSHIPAKDFQPVHFDPAIVEKMRNNDPKLLAEFQKLNPGVKTNPFAPTHNPKTGAVYDIARRTLESHELARQFKYPESWLTKNVHESHRLWIEDLTKSNAEHRNYRYNNPDGAPRNAGIGDKADFYHSVPLNERQAWERTIDTIEGHGYKHLTEKQRKLDKVVRGVNLYTTIAKIGGNIVSGLKQPTSLLNVSTVTDFPTLAKGLVDMMLSPVEARRKAVANGAAPFANEFPEYFGSSLGDQAGHIAKTASRLSTAFTGFMDGLTRSVAHEAAPHAMKLLQERIREGGKAKEATLRLLDDMLFKPEEIAEISSGKVSPATELKFKNSFVSYTQQSARMAERPRWTHEGYGKMIAHLRQFGLGQTRFHIQNVVKEAKTHGNYGPLRRAVIGAFVAGELVREAVSPFKADDEERKDWSKMKSADEVIYRTTQDMSDAALLGLLGDAGTKTIHGIITGKVPYKGDSVSDNVVPVFLSSFSNYFTTAQKMLNDPKLKHILSLLDKEFAAKRQFSELQKSGKNVDFKAVNDFFFAKPPKSQKPVLNLKPR